jgi:hypothetical protein
MLFENLAGLFAYHLLSAVRVIWVQQRRIAMSGTTLQERSCYQQNPDKTNEYLAVHGFDTHVINNPRSTKGQMRMGTNERFPGEPKSRKTFPPHRLDLSHLSNHTVKAKHPPKKHSKTN